MKRKAILGLVLVAMLVIGTGFGTYAWFTSDATSKENTIESGNLVVGLDVNENAATTANIALSGKFQPGDIVTVNKDGVAGPVKFEIKNTGDFNLVYFDNFVITSQDAKLGDRILIKNAENGVYKIDGNVKVWSDPYIVNGKPAYHYNGDEDGKITLNEWLANANTAMDLGGGWHYGPLAPGYKFVTQYELVFDEDATNVAGSDYSNLSLGLQYKVYSTQCKEGAVADLITSKFDSIRGTAPNWTTLNSELAKQN